MTSFFTSTVIRPDSRLEANTTRQDEAGVDTLGPERASPNIIRAGNNAKGNPKTDDSENQLPANEWIEDPEPNNPTSSGPIVEYPDDRPDDPGPNCSWDSGCSPKEVELKYQPRPEPKASGAIHQQWEREYEEWRTATCACNHGSNRGEDGVILASPIDSDEKRVVKTKEKIWNEMERLLVDQGQDWWPKNNKH
ncbi:hypothetical protein MKZ38_006772 [Zalerion maritima]|uniref:Uncharacterized protein n=1 Tax=Zalerion maritima TaxID=339359 RepID=A0AAD5RIJ1_9PEZI|nr:hypothetical protein MKZ38_006772 [Zalerion maritima]